MVLPFGILMQEDTQQSVVTGIPGWTFLGSHRHPKCPLFVKAAQTLLVIHLQTQTRRSLDIVIYMHKGIPVGYFLAFLITRELAALQVISSHLSSRKSMSS